MTKTELLILAQSNLVIAFITKNKTVSLIFLVLYVCFLGMYYLEKE